MTLFNDLKHAGEFNTDCPNIFTTQTGIPGQSDVLQLQIQVISNKINKVKFKAQGGITTLATAEYLARLITGMNFDQLSKINSKNIVNALQLPMQRINAALLAITALKNIIREIDYDR